MKIQKGRFKINNASWGDWSKNQISRKYWRSSAFLGELTKSARYRTSWRKITLMKKQEKAKRERKRRTVINHSKVFERVSINGWISLGDD